MGFPIFQGGSILFSNGMPAFSVNCCCAYRFKACFYVHASANGHPEEIPVVPPFMPGRAKSRFVYHGHVVDNATGGSRYHTHLWVIEVCYSYTYQNLAYISQLENWSKIDAKEAWTGVPDPTASGSFSGLITDCADSGINDIKTAILMAPEPYTATDLFGPIPRDWCPEAEL